MRARAYAAGTILNALATGVGSAFGIEMFAEVRLEPSERTEVFSGGRRIRRSPLVEEILSNLGLKARVEIRSEIPPGSGLGSSSAIANALILAAAKARGLEMEPEEILRLNASASLKAGVSYTGALDDAAASLLGGFVVTDNLRMEILRRDAAKGYAAVLVPKKIVRPSIDLASLKKEAAKLRKAVDLAKNGEYCGAMKENTRFYCSMLGYPNLAHEAWEMGVCAGLAGNGPCFCAFGSRNEMEEVADLWREHGKVIVRKLASKPLISV